MDAPRSLLPSVRLSLRGTEGVRVFIMSIMKVLSVILLTASVIAAQIPSSQKIKWQGLIGKENEFFFLIPEGFQISDDGEIYVGKKPNYIRVKNKRTVSRYINGIVLMMDLFEGKINEIQPALAEITESASLKEETINGFQVKSYLKKFSDFTWEQQHFFNKGSLYVMHAVYRNERSSIVENFFKSVRLVNKEQVVAPNFPKDTKKNLLNARLPDIVQESGSEEIAEQPDKKAIILYRPKPSFKMEFGRSNSGIVKLKVLLSASGKVMKVETVSSPNITLADGVRLSAEHLVFLPAEKNGKFVSSWETIEYEFQITTTGF